MLDYAQRLAPADGGISLAIGLLRLNLGDPRACEPFERLAGRTDWRDIRMALARVRMKFGQIERAAVRPAHGLSRSGPPVKHEFLALADAVCEHPARPAGAPSAMTGALFWARRAALRLACLSPARWREDRP